MFTGLKHIDLISVYSSSGCEVTGKGSQHSNTELRSASLVSGCEFTDECAHDSNTNSCSVRLL